MDLEKLTKDWSEDEQLNYLGFGSVVELVEHLKQCHAAAIEGNEFGGIGYLYKQQTKRVRELTQELKKCRAQMKPR